jgi:hypothetical protein
MRRSVWIFLASIFLPSLGLAWMAVRSTRDQQVVLEHQQVIICQNITDTLAQNIQSRMDGLRDDFVSTTQQLLNANASPQILAEDFNRKLRDAWPMAEIGFAVNLDGKIYSPKTYEGPEAQTFRSENDRFLSNRENVEVYSSNSGGLTQNSRNTQTSSAGNCRRSHSSRDASCDHSPARDQRFRGTRNARPTISLRRFSGRQSNGVACSLESQGIRQRHRGRGSPGQELRHCRHDFPRTCAQLDGLVDQRIHRCCGS